MRLPFFLRRTLARRILCAMLLAFAFLWLVMLVEQLVETNRGFDRDTLTSGNDLLRQIAKIEDPQEARVALRAISVSTNDNFHSAEVPITELIELTDRQGKLVYRSVEAGDTHLSDAPDGISTMTVNGKEYSVFKGRTDRWTLVFCNSIWNLGMIVQSVGGQMSFYMLLEFPFVLLPIWFAMSRGLGPLRRLSAAISDKDENDLHPIVVDAKYEELKPLAHALDRLLMQLRGKIEREHAFVQDAAHELRTPLAVISAQAHVLALAATPAERAEAEQRMDHAIGRASHLVQQLLALARVDAQRPLAREPLDLAHLVRQELAAAAPSAMQRRIDLSLDAPDRLAAELELEAFQSILHNLLDNAIRYVERGGQIVVELLLQGDCARLAVADNGPGIAPRERDKVFERFYRVPGHDMPGSGLGLSIVRQAAERLGGKVSLSAGLDGRGCSFTVDLPLS